jgi:DNA-binding CsgD family transcriptional regulator
MSPKDGDNAEIAARIAVSIDISDAPLAQRMISLLSGDAHLHILDVADESQAADVALADRVFGSRGPSILIDDGLERPDVLGGDIRAVLPPNVEGEVLRAAVRIVAAGFLIAEAEDRSGDEETPLTARESEVLRLLAQGASNKVVARELLISVHTAKFHVASLLAKLGARNRSDAIAIGLRRGLVLL